MKFPISLHLTMTRYLIRKRLKGVKRFPLVLMLEPTHRCNLHCAGCGRIREYHETLDQQLALEECLEAVETCGAPVVSITGGEPLLYDRIGALVREVLRSDRHVYLCTNGLLLSGSLDRFSPSSRFSFNVHLDGPSRLHDGIIGTRGVFDRALEGIHAAKARGFRVTTNTTIYRQTKPAELEELFDQLTQAGVDGLLVAPAYHYEVLDEGLFLSREDIISKFREIEPIFRRFNLISTPLYMDFLMGRRHLRCTPWGNPTRNPRGWRSPCYLIGDTHYPSYREFLEATDWTPFATGEDPRCRNCMMHCGFEPTVVDDVTKSLPDLWRMLVWNLR